MKRKVKIEKRQEKKKIEGWQHVRLTRIEAIETWPWLEKCNFQGGTFYMMNSGYGMTPQYERGTWLSGEWKHGHMLNCEFYGGKMCAHRSFFADGNWYNGTFEGFIMEKTNWYKGIFNGGYFTKSNFYDGEFRHGIFQNSWWHKGLIGEKVIVRHTTTKSVSVLDHIPKKMIVRQRKVHGKDHKDIQSESIQPKVKKRVQKEKKVTVKKQKVKKRKTHKNKVKRKK